MSVYSSDNEAPGTSKQLGMEDKQVENALSIIKIVEGAAEDQLLKCRQQLAEAAVHPGTSTNRQAGVIINEPINWAEDNTGELPPTVDPENPADQGPEIGDQIEDDISEEARAMLAGIFPAMLPEPENAATAPEVTPYLPARPEEASPAIPYQFTQYATQQDLSKLYAGMQDGFDKTLGDTYDLRQLLSNLVSEIRLVRDTQTSIGAQITELNGKFNSVLSLQSAAQTELIQMKQELSVCTVAFSKINSGLLSMAMSNVPVGKLPESSNFMAQSTPVCPQDVDTENRTPMQMRDDQCIALLECFHLDKANVPAYCKLLNNRTAQYFSKVFPTLFPGVSSTVAPALQLLSMPAITGQESMVKAIGFLKELIILRTTQQKISSVVSQSSTLPAASLPPNKAITKVKKVNTQLGF